MPFCHGLWSSALLLTLQRQTEAGKSFKVKLGRVLRHKTFCPAGEKSLVRPKCRVLFGSGSINKAFVDS